MNEQLPQGMPDRAEARSVWVAAAFIQLGSALVTLFGLLVLTFALGRLLPGDPVFSVLGDGADQSAYKAMYINMGLDKPIWEQFLMYLGRILQGDLGRSIITKNPVTYDIGNVFAASAELALFGLTLAIGIGVPVGVIAAAYRNSIWDYLVRIVGLIGYSAPGFWISLVGLMVFYGALGWLPGPGRISVVYQYTFHPITGFYLFDSAMQGRWDVFRDTASRLILPASVISFSSAAYIARMTRSFMLEQLSQEYVVTAAVKGLSYANIVWVQAFRAILVQLITVLALVFAFMLEGSVLVETIFAWSGLGRYMVNAITFNDMNATIASILFIGVMFMLVNLVTDVLYRVLDPRTRA
jgi:peptide/nickel transport system permease protein